MVCGINTAKESDPHFVQDWTQTPHQQNALTQKQPLTRQDDTSVSDHASTLQGHALAAGGAAGDDHTATAEDNVVSYGEQVELYDLQSTAGPVHTLTNLFCV